MAGTTVEIVLEKLMQLLLQHDHLIPNAGNQVEILKKCLYQLKALKITKVDAETKMVRDLTRRIRLAIYNAEDIIDAYAVQADDTEFFASPSIAHIVEDVVAVVKNFQCLFVHESRREIEFTPTKVKEGRQDRIEESQGKGTNAAGLEDEINTLKAYLFQESAKLDVISILGIGGLGKTTLAHQIFHDREIRQEFVKRIWVYASAEFRKKDIFLAILEGFTILTDDIISSTDEDLANLVVSYLDNERFLLVIDDVWRFGDYDELRVALPKSNKKGKVLITTRCSEFGYESSGIKFCHEMRFWTNEETYRLFMSEVTGTLDLSPELQHLGKLITECCGGHPLSTMIIGGIVVNIPATREAWENFYKNLKRYVGDLHPVGRLKNIIELGYKKLPYRLRECYLYFRMFPEDFEIPAWKLIRLWIAEGFILLENHLNLEETGEKYLEELINRRLVKAEKFKLDGKIKTCRIHDMLRDFCLAEAGKLSLFQEIRATSNGGIPPRVSRESVRRLCIHSNVLDFVSAKPECPSTRSFIYSSREEITMPLDDISAIPKGFKRLRVLDVEGIKFIDKLPRNMSRLYHLRYLVLSVNLKVLPSAFSKLWNIQTLVVNTTSRTLEIRADLLNLTRLTHFKTKASAALRSTCRSSEASGREIHTLGAIVPENLTNYFFERVPNLKSLGVRGKLALLLDEKKDSFDSLSKLSNLEKLKLLNDIHPEPPSEFQLCGLPPASKFPQNLKILTLSRTSIDWNHMSVLGALESLVVLKVKDKAFVGGTWKVADGGFRHLEVLHIERTNLKIWLASKHHFPRLRHLQLKHCDYLERVPTELAYVPSFMKLTLFHCKRAAASALQIEEKKKHHSQFELFIAPWSDTRASV